ncbi:trichohyalin-like [Oryzias latipes]|uniref:trichohyalin-like n=1 Tax=Oryzias latipes TaxID=8090 RepID=UPI000CE19212|nr:trichohyalin-like [Oryzias latipes]
MESSTRRSVRKTRKTIKLSNFESVVEKEPTSEFDTIMDWDDTDEDYDDSPPSYSDEEFPDMPETPHYDYSLLSKSEDEEFPENPETPQPKRQQDWGKPMPKICPQNQTLGLKPLSFAPTLSFRPASLFPVKPVSVPKSTQPEEVKPLGKEKQSATALDKPTSTSKSTSVVNAEALQEITALKDEVGHLKELLQQKDQMLADAALKTKHLEEQVSHLTEERQQLGEEKSSFLQEIAQLKTAQEDRETEVTNSKRVPKKKIVQLLREMEDLKMQQQQEHLDLKSKLDMEKESLLNDHQLGLTVAQNQLAKEREEWQSRNTALMQDMAALRRKYEEESSACYQKEKTFLELLSHIEEGMEKLKETIREKDAIISNTERVSKKSIVQLQNQMAGLKRQQQQEHLELTRKFEREKERLLYDHQLALTVAQNQLTKEREEWQSKNTSLMQDMAALRRKYEEDSSVCYQKEKTFMELLSHIDEGVEKLKETIREKDAIINNSKVILRKKLEQEDERLKMVKKAYRKKNLDLGLKLHQMEEELQQERVKTNQAKLSFDLEVEESTKLKAALAQVQKELEGQKQLERERQQLEEEKSTLLQQIGHLQVVVKEKETLISESQEALLVQLQQQVDDLKEKPPKKSAGRRFLNLFRKSRKKD